MEQLPEPQQVLRTTTQSVSIYRKTEVRWRKQLSGLQPTWPVDESSNLLWGGGVLNPTRAQSLRCNSTVQVLCPHPRPCTAAGQGVSFLHRIPRPLLLMPLTNQSSGPGFSSVACTTSVSTLMTLSSITKNECIKALKHTLDYESHNDLDYKTQLQEFNVHFL